MDCPHAAGLVLLVLFVGVAASGGKASVIEDGKRSSIEEGNALRVQGRARQAARGRRGRACDADGDTRMAVVGQTAKSSYSIAAPRVESERKLPRVS